jgi:hypothetical protein
VVVLFLPIIPFAPSLFKWMKPEAASDHLLVHKAAYLNPTFFYIRAFVFVVLWAGLALWFYKNSREQDQTGSLDLSRKMGAFSAPAMFLFALSLSFAAFDWIMSLDPHWYSTIFGVYIFAGAATSSLSALALVMIKMQQTSVLGDLCTVEHQHDVGKLLFGFVVFWAYIGFSQFMLIWYANIPEETLFYLHRWEGSWKAVSLALVFGHFVVPFWMLISRTAKRSPTLLGTAAILLLVLHYVDLYWLVMPTLDHHGAHPSWIDLAGLLAPLGIAMVVVSRRALGDPAYPLKDPFIHEALRAENL